MLHPLGLVPKTQDVDLTGIKLYCANIGNIRLYRLEDEEEIGAGLEPEKTMVH